MFTFVDAGICVQAQFITLMAIFNSAKNATFNPQEINIINSGTIITGDVVSEGDLRIDGSVRGKIQVKSKLVLGPSSRVDGDITALNCDISGVVNGNMTVTELLTVKSTARVQGDISSAKLVIEAGAEFNGKSSMNANKSTSNGAQKPSNPVEARTVVSE